MLVYAHAAGEDVVVSMVSFAASISNIDGWLDRVQDREAEQRARRQGGSPE